MAENLGQQAPPIPGDNEQQEIIAAVIGAVLPLEEQRKVISKQITTEKAKVKGFMKIKDLDTVMRLHKLEGDEQLDALKSIRRGFMALNIGAQGILFAE